jgi:hypothetical protein
MSSAVPPNNVDQLVAWTRVVFGTLKSRRSAT